MRKIYFLSIMALAAGLPLSAQAQQQSSPAQPPSEHMAHRAGFDGDRALVVGAGVIVGGLLANWWYNERMGAPALAQTRKAP